MSERQKQVFGTREPINSLRLEGTRLSLIDSVVASICLVTCDYLIDYFKDLFRYRQARRQFRERQIQFIVENPTPGVQSTLSIHGLLEELKTTPFANPFIHHRRFSLNNPERAAFSRILKSRRS